MRSNDQKSRSGVPPQESMINGATPNQMKGMTPIERSNNRNGNNTLQYKNPGMNVSSQSNW